MVRIKFHGLTAYDNGLLDIHLKTGDQVEITKEKYVQFRADLGEVRFRSEVEIIQPSKLRRVKEYFKA